MEASQGLLRMLCLVGIGFSIAASQTASTTTSASTIPTTTLSKDEGGRFCVMYNFAVTGGG